MWPRTPSASPLLRLPLYATRGNTGTLDTMTPEMYAILGVGVALATLILASSHRIESRPSARMDRLEGSVSELRERMAHLEGLLEGLREAIAHNRAA